MEFAGYRVLGSLGQGGMAQVFLASSEKQPGFTKLFVLKVLKEEFREDGDLLAMFVQEGRIAARLNHANVVQTYEVGTTDNVPFIAMEFLEGASLSAAIRRIGSGLSLDLHVRIVADVLCGLHYAHELTDFDGNPMGVVHRDVSPHNVFLTYDGGVKLLDFGIAKIASSPTLTIAGVVKGKLNYMAPEQARSRPIDRRADIFAVGIMLWEALAGRRFIEPGTHEAAALTARIAGEIPSIREIAPHAPEDVVAITERALRLEPDERFATAEEMQLALEAYLRDASNPQPRDVGRLLRTHFAVEREKLKKTIEEQLSKPGGSVPFSSPFSGPLLSSPGGTPAKPQKREVPHDADTQLTPGGLWEAGPATPPPGEPAPSPRVWSARNLALAIIGGVLVVGGAAVATVELRKPAPREVMVTAAPSASGSELLTPPASATSEAPEAPAARVTLTLTVTPKDAVLSLDGEPVAAGKVTRDLDPKAPHELKVDARGHQSVTRSVIFDRDQTIAIDLAPVGAPTVSVAGGRRTVAPAGPQPRPQAPTTPAATPPAPRPSDSGFNEIGKRTPRPIDTSTPF